ncbi:hypothetical protein QJQ45_012780 [Haematococcus lacustris]|nr:hypothetical protein QJQ45_012780 [Haematococcus lacustris]
MGLRAPRLSQLKPVVVPAMVVVAVVVVVTTVATTVVMKGKATGDSAQLTSSPPTQAVLTSQPGSQVAISLTFYGLDLWSLVTSWGSRMQELLDAQQPRGLSLLELTAPGMCASQLLSLNTTALFNTSLTAQQLMPGLTYFASDVAQLLRDFLQDSNVTVQVADFCAGNRTHASSSRQEDDIG